MSYTGPLKHLLYLPKNISIISSYIRHICDKLTVISHNIIQIKEISIFIANNTATLTTEKHKDERYLARYQSQVYSQNNEDGIIAEIFRRIGNKTYSFIEIGVENGIESNSRFLLQNGWKGTWIEGNQSHIEEINKYFSHEIQEKNLKVVHSHVTTENINLLFKENDIPKEYDFLSIDIDMNTHHIWDAIDGYNPMVACIEYNASIPPSIDFSIPYDPEAAWDQSNNFGAGLKTLELIGRKKGYTLVGCDCNGINAFFIRNDLVEDKFLPPFTAESHYEPPRYNSMLHHTGHFSFKPIIDRELT